MGHKNLEGELCNARLIDCKLIILYLIKVLWLYAVMLLCHVQMYHPLFTSLTYCLHLSPFLSVHYAYHCHLLIMATLMCLECSIPVDINSTAGPVYVAFLQLYSLSSRNVQLVASCERTQCYTCLCHKQVTVQLEEPKN